MADVDIADVTTGTVDSGDDLLGVGRPANVARLFSVSSIITLAQTFASPLIAPSGSASAPSYSFSGDTNTGIYASAADTIALATGGTQRATLSSSSLSTSVPIYAPIGAGGVDIGVTSDRGIGSEGGSHVFLKSSSGKLNLFGGFAFTQSGEGFGISSHASVGTTAPDIALVRNDVALFEVTDGSTGGGGFVFREHADFSAPASNKVVLYARDTGGKTELVARFPTGAIQQVAIEP